MKSVSSKLTKLRLNLAESIELLDQIALEIGSDVDRVPLDGVGLLHSTVSKAADQTTDPGLVSKAEWHQRFVALSERARDSKKSERLELLRELLEMVGSAIKVMTEPVGGDNDD